MSSGGGDSDVTAMYKETIDSAMELKRLERVRETINSLKEDEGELFAVYFAYYIVAMHVANTVSS